MTVVELVMLVNDDKESMLLGKAEVGDTGDWGRGSSEAPSTKSVFGLGGDKDNDDGQRMDERD